jgi:hypothetical protein
MAGPGSVARAAEMDWLLERYSVSPAPLALMPDAKRLPLATAMDGGLLLADGADSYA